MNDSGGVHGIYGIGNLADDLTNFLGWQGDMLFGVLLEELTQCPLDGQEVYTRSSFPNFDGPNDVRVGHSSPVRCFPEKSCDCSLVGPQLLLQHLDGNDAMNPVLGAVYHCRSTFTNHILQRVSGECRTGKIFTAHGPKVISPTVGSKRTMSRVAGFTVDSHHR